MQHTFDANQPPVPAPEPDRVKRDPELDPKMEEAGISYQDLEKVTGTLRVRFAELKAFSEQCPPGQYPSVDEDGLHVEFIQIPDDVEGRGKSLVFLVCRGRTVGLEVRAFRPQEGGWDVWYSIVHHAN